MFDSSLDEKEPIRTLTRDEAEVVKTNNPPLNPWRVVVWQSALLVIVVLFVWLLDFGFSVLCSVAWGGLCVIVPNGVFARGLMSRANSLSVAAATGAFFIWEGVKVFLTLAMLYVAPRVLSSIGGDISWIGLIVGFVVVMKVFWVALLYKPRVHFSKVKY